MWIGRREVAGAGEVAGARVVALDAADVARLRVARAAVVREPEVVILAASTSASSSYGVNGTSCDVLAAAEAQRADQVARPRRELAVDGRVAERRERDDEAC